MKKKILIIDDDKDFMDITMKVLVQIGKFEVVASGHNEDAMAIVRREKPDLLLLDIMMPKVDGFTICKEIKDAEDLRNVKIIVYSAKIFDVDRKKALQLGADAYVSKVIESNKLIDTIHQVLGSN
ncbi:MAG: response regulator [Bacteroidetes bacterium]|nr:response regulator [Bacteroidota bacterium]